MSKPVNLTAGVLGLYGLQVFNADHQLVKEVKPFHNLVTNSGLQGLYNANSSFSTGCRYTCRVGSGSTPASITDVNLETQVAKKDGPNSRRINLHNYNAGTPQDYYIATKLTWEFTQGAAAGNLSEVGVGYSNSTNGGALFSRALIKDQNGAPATITVLADEYLVVSYELRYYPFINGPATGTVDGYSFKVYPAGANSSAWSITETDLDRISSARSMHIGPDPLTDPFDITTNTTTGLTEVASYGLSNQNYDSVNHTVVKRITLGPTQGNQLAPSSIRVMTLNGLVYAGGNNRATWIVEFTPAIPKDSTKALTIDFLLSLANYTPPA